MSVMYHLIATVTSITVYCVKPMHDGGDLDCATPVHFYVSNTGVYRKMFLDGGSNTKMLLAMQSKPIFLMRASVDTLFVMMCPLSHKSKHFIH